MLEHPFIMQTLKCFCFGEKFIKIIKIFDDINSSVSLPFGTSRRFEVKRGIRQGCLCSPLIFIIVAELLAILIQNSSVVQPFNVMGSSLVISQLTDDTTLFIKNTAQIPAALNEVSLFTKAYGLNVKKCELLAIHDHPLINMQNIPVNIWES